MVETTTTLSPHQTTNLPINEDFNTQTSTFLSTTTPVTFNARNDDDEPAKLLLRILIIFCFVIVIFLIVIGIYFGLYDRRRNSTLTDASVESDTSQELALGIQEGFKSESQRSSILIEVMTGTLSNMIKEQGGKTDNSKLSVASELVKMKPLNLSNDEIHYCNHSKSLINGKRSSTLQPSQNTKSNDA